MGGCAKGPSDLQPKDCFKWDESRGPPPTSYMSRSTSRLPEEAAAMSASPTPSQAGSTSRVCVPGQRQEDRGQARGASMVPGKEQCTGCAATLPGAAWTVPGPCAVVNSGRNSGGGRPHLRPRKDPGDGSQGGDVAGGLAPAVGWGAAGWQMMAVANAHPTAVSCAAGGPCQTLVVGAAHPIWQLTEPLAGGAPTAWGATRCSGCPAPPGGWRAGSRR